MRTRIHSVLVLLALALPASAQQWHQAESKTFLVTSTAGEAEARRTLVRAEQLKTVFGQILRKTQVNTPRGMHLLVIRDPQTLQQADIGLGADTLAASARLYSGLERRAVLMKPDQWESATALIGSVLLETNYPKTPAWFDAGFATYFGALQLARDSVQLGLAPGGLKPAADWIPLTALLTMPAAPENPQWAHQSWLFVHWILSNGRLDAASKYFQAVMTQGAEPRVALEIAFTISAADLDRELRDYASKAGSNSRKIPAPSVADAGSYPVRKITPEQAVATLADVALDSPGEAARTRALSQLQAMMRQNPEEVRIHRALAYAYMRAGDATNGLEHVRRAINLGDTNPATYYWHAVAHNGGREDVIEIQSADVRLAPMLNAALKEGDFPPASDLLGLALMSAGRDEQARRAFGRAASLRPRNEIYLLHLAESQVATGDAESAKALFSILRHSDSPEIARRAEQSEKVASRAVSRQERFESAQSTYKDITDPRWRPKPAEKASEPSGAEQENSKKPDLRKTQYVKGTLLAIDCSTGPGATLSVHAAGKLWTFAVEDRKSVLLLGAEQFDCAWAKRPVSINYKASGTREGDVVSLEVQ